MKIRIATLISLVFIGSLFNLNAASFSDKTVADFIRRFPNPDSICWRPGSNHFSWQAGYILFAMEKYWLVTHDSVCFNYIKKYVDQQVTDDGHVPDFKNDELDNFLPGYAVLFMYQQTGAEKYKRAATQIKNGFMNYPRTSNGLFWHAAKLKNQVWVDGVFMGQIFLARYAALIGDKEQCYNEIAKQMTLITEKCQKQNGLLLHGWDESRKAPWANKQTGLSSEVWSEGLGWYALLSTEIFDYLPENHVAYNTIMANHIKLCKGLKSVVDKKTGMWCQVADKPDKKGNWAETSGTAMFIYALQKSVQKGYIESESYQPIIAKAYLGLIKKAKLNKSGYIDLRDCSSIGIKNSYNDYISQPKEISPFAAYGSFMLGTTSVEYSTN